MAQRFPELGCYGLAGHSATPRDLIDEARLAEELGIGSMFLSERFATKDAGVLAGAAIAEIINPFAGSYHNQITKVIIHSSHQYVNGSFL